MSNYEHKRYKRWFFVGVLLGTMLGLSISMLYVFEPAGYWDERIHFDLEGSTSEVRITFSITSSGKMMWGYLYQAYDIPISFRADTVFDKEFGVKELYSVDGLLQEVIYGPFVVSRASIESVNGTVKIPLYSGNMTITFTRMWIE